MAVDTKDRIDIRKLTIEEPKVETPISPFSVITDRDWPEIEQMLEEHREDLRSPEFLYRLYELNVLFPGKLANYNNSKTFEIVKEDIEIFKETGGNNADIVHTMELVKQFWPERLERLSKQVKLKSFKDVIEERLNWTQIPFLTLQQAAAYKGIYPDENFQFNVDEAIQQIKNMQIQTHQRDIKLIFYLSTLAAKEIRFSERGLELIMPAQPQVADPSSLPETRKF